MLREILRAMYGDVFNQRIVDSVEALTSADHVAEYIRTIKWDPDLHFPFCCFVLMTFQSKQGIHCGQTEHQPCRDHLGMTPLECVPEWRLKWGFYLAFQVQKEKR
jgi:Sorting nexin C terminal